MKRKLVFIAGGLCAMTLLSGCIGLEFSFGGGKKDQTSTTTTTSNNTANNSTANNNQTRPVVQQTVAPTVGQQLLDLKKAFDAGAISGQDYQTEKAKILAEKQ